MTRDVHLQRAVLALILRDLDNEGLAPSEGLLAQPCRPAIHVKRLLLGEG